MNSPYHNQLLKHYSRFWSASPTIKNFQKGPIHRLPNDFCVLEYPTDTNDTQTVWKYGTGNMSGTHILKPIELHILTYEQDSNDEILELLTVITDYHNTGAALDIGHTVNFGRGWRHQSLCSFGLISLPYLNGSKFENFRYNRKTIKCLWLIPITEAERKYKIKYGLEALESIFEQREINYADPYRESYV